MKLRNKFHKEHRVEFPDNSEDNNNSEDIDGQEINCIVIYFFLYFTQPVFPFINFIIQLSCYSLCEL